MAKIVNITQSNGYWERLDRRVMRARVEDAIARVTAAGERIRAERRARKVVDLNAYKKPTVAFATTTPPAAKPRPRRVPLAIVKLATSKLDAYLVHHRKKGRMIRVLMRPYHAGVSAVRAVLEVEGKRVRIYFRESERGWRKA